MANYFISDLHLSPKHPHLSELFFNFLKEIEGKADNLYILGDLFELWLGNDIQTDFQQTIIDAIHRCQQAGTVVYFMPGNRDFLIDNTFHEKAGWVVLTDPTCIDLYGTSVLLMHGDTLCTKDVVYLRLRYWALQAWIKKLVLALPRALRLKIATKFQNASRKHQQQAVKKDLDAQLPAIKQALANADVDVLIHGHTHLPSIHLFRDNANADWQRRYVLSDWGESGHALVWDEDLRSLV